VLEITFILF